METSRPPLPDLTPIRSILRNVRQVMRDKRDRIQTDAPSILPRPASTVAMHLLRDLDFVARGVDGILSDVAHHIFPESTTPAVPAPAEQDVPMRQALAATGQRLQVRDIPAFLATAMPKKGAALDARSAASHLMAMQPHLTQDETLALFAACLSLLATWEEDRAPSTVTEAAADLTRAMAPMVRETIGKRDPSTLAAFLLKYAAHV